ncbi:hypothetical protein ACHAW5_005850 [Stephanodiscus triporus]|uniref:RNase H type-1 domain-containing protein n=1 Tax=Stephanodiscus triporus TaxID=2934178 RepID=A0ABD3MYJ1_9STRA
MPYYHRLILYFDGASRSNPRKFFFIVKWRFTKGTGMRILFSLFHIGQTVQLVAAGFSKKWMNTGPMAIGDAEIVLRQSIATTVNSDNIRPHYRKACELVNQVDSDSHTFRHISRDRNWEADALANKAIEENAYNIIL